MSNLFAATGDAVARIRVLGEVGTVEVTLEGSGARSLALDPHDPVTLYAGARGTGVWKSTDGGHHWKNLSLPEQDVFSVAVSAADGALYAGCEPSRLFVSRDGGRSWTELESLQDIPSRPQWSFPPRPWTSHVRWIAPSPHQADLLLVGIELGGLMHSGDGGQTWSDHRPGAQRDVHTLAWHPRVPGREYEAAGGGAAWSRDGGLTWEPADQGRNRHYTYGLTVDPDDPDCWYVSASPGPRQAHDRDKGADAFIYRWRGDGPWQPLGGGLPQPLEGFPYALTNLAGGLYAGLSDGRIYQSLDRGDSWRQLELQDVPLPKVLALAGL